MKKIDIKFLLKRIIFIIIVTLFFLILNNVNIVLANSETKNQNEFCYLSDISYIHEQSSSGWKELKMNQDSNGDMLSVKVENAYYTFDKGIWAHAPSIVVYDLSQYSQYDYFTAYIGLNKTAATSSNGVKFYIYTSVNGTDWELETDSEPEVSKPGANAKFVKVDIKGDKYLKLYANDNGANGNDHSVYADAKLIKETYDEGKVVEPIEEYDKKIKEYDNKSLEDEGDELLLLQRNLVKNAGEYALTRFVNESEENRQTFSWLFNDVENLRLYTLGGKPTGSYMASLKALNDLYQTYNADFEIKTVSKYGNVVGDLYKRMAITLSLTHSAQVALWMQPSAPENQSDAVTRYAIYKKLYSEGKFVVSTGESGIDITKWFEEYNIEEMRFVLNNIIDDEEILWLNEYTQSQIEAHPGREWSYLTPHPYMAYVWPNYGNAVFHDPDKKDYWDEKFGGIFSKYGVTYTSDPARKIYKVWMNFRNEFGTGAVCGGISKTGSNIRTVHGIPAAVIGQPGHAAIIYYSQDANGNGYWNIDNDVSGWTLSEKSERMLLGWGNASYSRGYSVVYMALAQEALNDYENFEKCEKLVMLANSYSGNLEKQEEIYRKALEVQPINIDAWYGLINVYNQNTNKTEDEYFELAKEVAENLKYFPLPMQHLTNLIKPKITSIENSYRFTLLQTRILTEASKTPNNTADNYYVYQPSVTRVEANYLLGKLDKTIATFSFDGENAGKIVLSDRFNGNGVRWDYAIIRNDTGEKVWKEVSFTAEEPHELQLTPEEIESITAENDIYIHIVGVNYDEENLYKIDIQESNLGSNLYANDWENKLIGATSTMQWKLNEADEWTTYSEAEPDLTGDKTLIVRTGATGIYLASKESKIYNFTQNNEPNTRRYIPISHLSVNSVSSEATGQKRHATNSIDGNINTSWHSAWNGSDTEKYIIIKLDEPKHLSSLEYFPLAGGNGKILNAVISVSMDGDNWDEVVSETNWTYTSTNDISMKSVDFEPTKAQYIKIQGKRTQSASSSQSFIAAAMFNLYEDTTVKTVATFSFNGENAGKILLEDEYKSLNWKYSIDSGNTWKNVNEGTCKLSDEEISEINENDKIKVVLDGDTTEYIINIKKGTAPERGYLNDLENRPIGLNNINDLEWKYVNDTNWISYEEQEPLATGNKTLLVRKKAKGIYTASENVEYQFTEDNQSETARYIPISHLTVTDCSTESPDRGEPKTNAIDGNINTMWHTDHTLTDDPRFIVIKLDEPKYISKLQYAIKSGYAYGVIKDAVIYTSMDGENWEEAVVVKDLFNPSDKDELISSENVRDILFGESKQAQYIKLQCTKSCDYVNGSKNGVPYDYFLAASMINLFEDTTKTPDIPDNSDTPDDPNKPDTPDTPDDPNKPDIPENPGTEIEEGELFFKSKYKTIKEDENQYLYKIDSKLTLKEFIESCETNGIITVYKQDGTILKENEFIGTGMILKDKKDGNDKEISLMLSVIGDIDENGEVTPTDLAEAIQKTLGENNLNELQLLATDINEDGEITPTDLAEMIKMTLE